MAQYDIYRNPNAALANQPAFFVVLQSDFVENLTTHLVAPLYDPQTIGPLPAKLGPPVTVEGDRYIAAMPQMAGVPKARMGAYAGSAREHRDAFTAAIDFLLSGF